MTADGAPIFDPAVIAELRETIGDDEAFIADLVRTYADEGGGLLGEMNAAIAAGDPAALVRPAHTMKSSSASIGAMRLSDVCRDIEGAARDGRPDGLAAGVATAGALWTATLKALDDAGLLR